MALLRDRATTDPNWDVRRAAVQAIAAGWADHEGTLPLLRDRATTDPNDAVRRAAGGGAGDQTNRAELAGIWCRFINPRF